MPIPLFHLCPPCPRDILEGRTVDNLNQASGLVHVLDPATLRAEVILSVLFGGTGIAAVHRVIELDNCGLSGRIEVGGEPVVGEVVEFSIRHVDDLTDLEDIDVVAFGNRRKLLAIEGNELAVGVSPLGRRDDRAGVRPGVEIRAGRDHDAILPIRTHPLLALGMVVVGDGQEVEVGNLTGVLVCLIRRARPVTVGGVAMEIAEEHLLILGRDPSNLCGLRSDRSTRFAALAASYPSFRVRQQHLKDAEEPSFRCSLSTYGAHHLVNPHGQGVSGGQLLSQAHR